VSYCLPARFGMMVMGHACAIRTPPKSHVLMGKLFKFYSRLLHPKAIAGKAADYFSGVFTDF
jgi:hypothetical protein